MVYELLFTDIALRQLRKLDKQVRVRILGALERVRIRPYAHVTKLVGDPGYRLRVGSWRVLLDIQENKLIILALTVAHRSTIYKR
ncbi:MAG: type II toxin-antitoxin system RelE/ParE family toxin [Candidatus Undinarchaeales archaeon]|jgi:mRNA interferase RelE/StbE|nr:type II toxin-antitoxin system RelE/ParE family toxin [Candidatus Undinarchaeales archaeon]MDP7494550.1 type II toxin-antitoxin system RelE/ParE family toxin [Candidatus Undinarchaeales archaeon]